jgi:hypothetical protein
MGGAVVGLTYSHGTTRHGNDAATVRQCLNDNGHLQLWANDDMDHRARVCEVSPGVFGLQIVKLIAGKWEEITAYIPRQAVGLEGIGKYLAEIGYKIVWSVK